MNMKIFAVRDTLVEAYLQPFFSPTMGAAIRSLQEVVNDPQHTFSKHATDYALYELGDFDDASGVIDAVDPKRIISLIELVKAQI